jgi:hypothetical protein
MSTQAQDWMLAASYCEGPRPAVGFGDLPRQHQSAMLRLGLVAAASTAYFIALGVLAQPIPSRSLPLDAALPAALAARPALLDARLEMPVVTPSTRPSWRHRTVRQHDTLEVVALQVPTGDADRQTNDPRPERRRNIFSRIFRGVWRSAQAPAARVAPL